MKSSHYPSYTDDVATVQRFLSSSFPTSTLDSYGQPILAPTYLNRINDIVNRTSNTLEIELEHIQKFAQVDPFFFNFLYNTKRYIDIFYRVVDELIANDKNALTWLNKSPSDQSSTVTTDLESNRLSDPYENFLRHRLTRLAETKKQIMSDNPDNANQTAALLEQFPAELHRFYDIMVIPRKYEPFRPLRDIKANDVSRYVSIYYLSIYF
jgi:hypothetical protein